MHDQATITRVYEVLKDTYPTFDEGDDEWMTSGMSDTPFRVIVATALSTVTHSKRVIRACTALFAEVSTFEGILALTDDELRELIRPVAHYNMKTLSLKKMSQQIMDRHDGQIPNTHDELMALAGIGRKCTDIVMTTLFDESSVAVDTHVHRAVNRLGIVHTTTHVATADALNRITPFEYKRHAHEWLIQHGGKVCVAGTPKCGACPLTDYCDYFQKTRQSVHGATAQPELPTKPRTKK
ncbi:endonuclease III domain-containing protein [Cryobacterium melibiosiphilum]|nr:endonuclease III [Cryobacterium melibiosiphilum]